MPKKKSPPSNSLRHNNDCQSKANNNSFIPKAIKVLRWLYEQSMRSKISTAFDSFNTNQDTAFRTHVSKLGSGHKLDIKRRWTRNSNTGSQYKEYWIEGKDIQKAKAILKLYYSKYR